MKSTIQYQDIVFPIAHIAYMNIIGKTINIGLAGSTENGFIYLDFESEHEASTFYQKYLQKIEDYYTAMMPNSSHETQIAHDEDNKAYRSLAQMANYIDDLYALIDPGRRNNCLGFQKMEFLKKWIEEKTKKADQ